MVVFAAGMPAAHAFDFVEKLSDKILNECGVVAAITSGLAIYFARLATKNRDGWDIDRDGLIKMMIANNDRDAKAMAVYSKIEGMLSAAQAKR